MIIEHYFRDCFERPLLTPTVKGNSHLLAFKNVFVTHWNKILPGVVTLVLRRGSRRGEMGEFSTPFFWAPFFFFSYWLRWRMCISDDRFYQSSWCSNLKHLNQALVLLHYYKNSPPISKSWIRAWILATKSKFFIEITTFETTSIKNPSVRLFKTKDISA